MRIWKLTSGISRIYFYEDIYFSANHKLKRLEIATLERKTLTTVISWGRPEVITFLYLNQRFLGGIIILVHLQKILIPIHTYKAKGIQQFFNIIALELRIY